MLAVDGGQTASYVYDAQNHRVRIQNPSGTFEFLYDAMGRRTSTWNAANNFGIEGRIYMDGSQFAFRGGNGGETLFDHKDVLGTPSHTKTRFRSTAPLRRRLLEQAP